MDSFLLVIDFFENLEKKFEQFLDLIGDIFIMENINVRKRNDSMI